MDYTSWTFAIGALVFVIHSLGTVAAFDAVMYTRTPQGALAWALALVSFPYLSLPLYLIFGRKKFYGYVVARRREGEKLGYIIAQLEKNIPQFRVNISDLPATFKVFQSLAKRPFTNSNDLALLVDGEATFGAIFEAIKKAREYVLIQFYVVHDDELGRSLRDLLMTKIDEGVKIYFLYDEIGSNKLTKSYVRTLDRAGVNIRPFLTTRGARNRFQLNFRNHRKIVICDGEVGFVGGHNVGDEYMGRISTIGEWRDTHVKIDGPAVLGFQLTFVEDWHWSTAEVPNLSWYPQPSKLADQICVAVPTGPADVVDSCALFFLHAINSATKRIWIASPYFVPDSQILSALQLAVMRGVEVKIIIPARADHILVYLASFSYFSETIPFGVEFYRYQRGFMHQKILLVDDDIASVGSANFDNRSFRLNFEVGMLSADKKFALEVESMLKVDLSNSARVTIAEIDDRSRWFKFIVRLVRTLAPVL